MRTVVPAALVLAVAAAVALVALREDPPERVPRTPFTALAGASPVAAGPDVWRLGFGTSRVKDRKSVV